MNNATKIIDLSHSLSASIPTWDASCGFISKIRHDYDVDDSKLSFRIQEISMHAGIGTHIDAPAHCFRGGKTIDSIALSDLFAPCAVIDVSPFCDEHLRVGTNHLKAWEDIHGAIPEKCIVIIHTGWDRFFGDTTKYRNNLVFPCIDKEAALYLSEKNILGLGMDTLSPDLPDSGYPVHEILLGTGIYIIENVANAGALSPLGATVLVLPLKIQNGTEAPVRLVGFMPS
jgi:kynurenine formamidase